MPVVIPSNLPAFKTLANEKVFVMPKLRAATQDIRPLKIAILNLMPTKEVTETQLLRLLANSPLQIEIQFVALSSYTPKNVNPSHMEKFYRKFDELQKECFDAMIITGAPVEHLSFDAVAYWPELKQIMEFSKTNVYSTLHICWGAQAGLFYHYGVKKMLLDKKIFGVFPHRANNPNHELTRGFDDVFDVPHSRMTEISRSDIERVKELDILAESDQVGLHMIASHDNRQIFLQGHFEYDRNTLRLEYERDKDQGVDITMPANYFNKDDSSQEATDRWRAHGNLFFHNWLNMIYQGTPYDLDDLPRSTLTTP